MSDAKTCLVVDDSRMIRRVASRILKELKFETEEAENGQDAIDRCRIAMPDAVLLDWNMPVLTPILSSLNSSKRASSNERCTLAQPNLL